MISHTTTYLTIIYSLYMLGSICFFAGSAIALWRHFVVLAAMGG